MSTHAAPAEERRALVSRRLGISEVWVRGDLSTQIQVLLRWGAVLGQAMTLMTADRLGVAIPWIPCGSILAFILLTNAALVWWLRSVQRHLGDGFFHIALLDILTLAMMLYWTGGLANPFASFLLIQILLAALALRTTAILSLSLLTAGASLFLWQHSHPLLMKSGDPLTPALEAASQVVALLLGGLFIVAILVSVRRRSHRLQTERTKLRREMDSQERFLSVAALATGFAHELATPLGTIALATEELLQTDPRPESQLILAETRRARDILNRLRYLGQDSQTLSGQLRSAGELLDSALTQLSQAEQRRIAVSKSPTTRHTHTFLPSTGLEEALLVILRNALAASPEPSPIHLQLSIDSNRARYTVTDHGPGFSPEMLHHWGEPFRTDRPTGMGLGLFFVRRLAAAKKGHLTVANSPGGGAVVTLELPLPPTP